MRDIDAFNQSLVKIAWIAAISLTLFLPGAAPAAPLALFEEIAPPAGRPTEGKTLTSNNDEINVLSRDQGLRIGAVPLPDVHPTYLRFDDGSIRFWIQGRGGTSIFTTTDFKSFTPSPISSHAHMCWPRANPCPIFSMLITRAAARSFVSIRDLEAQHART